MSLVLDSGLYFPAEVDREDSSPLEGIDYLEETARSVELVREEGRDGHLGSFGFTLIQEKPPRVGTVIPGGPADRAGLKKGEIILTVAGKDVTRLSHKEVTLMIRSTTETAIWLSVSEADENSDMSMMSSSVPSSFQLKSHYASSPVLASQHNDRRFHSLQQKSFNNSSLISAYGSPTKPNLSPLIQKKSVPQNDPAYVVFVPQSSYMITRMWSALLYCGPVKIPESWSSRGVSSLCIQECARQLLGKRKPEEFIKIHLEVSQTSMRITNISGNVLAKHRRDELYYCGLCSSDEQHFAIVTLDSETTSRANLCHVFKLLSDSKLSKYCIDKSKSLREVRSGQPSLLKSCTEITETIESIFQNDIVQPASTTLRKSTEKLTDSIEYGVVRGINMFQPAPGSNDSLLNAGSHASSPMLKRKRSNVVDLRARKDGRTKQRSISNPGNPFEIRPLAVTSSAGHVRNGEPVHIRMASDGSTASSTSSMTKNRSLPVALLRTSVPQDKAKRISDSSLSSVSSDQSGHRSHSSSPNAAKTGSGSPTPYETAPAHHLPRSLPRKQSTPFRIGAASPSEFNGGGVVQSQLKRQNSESSILDLPGLSPYHASLPPKRSSSVDSIVTITTLAEDDIDAVVGQVAGWCGNFDKLLTDPLGLQCFTQFLKEQHGEENIFFWRDVEEFKTTPEPNIQEMAKRIFDEYLSQTAPQSINIDGRVLNAIEPLLASPTRHMYNEAQKDIYQLMKLDCYPRFKKSQIIKDCLCAEMEGRPLPINPHSTLITPAAGSKAAGANYGAWGKKKNPSILSRILQHKSTTAPSLNPPPVEHPLARTNTDKKNKKERRDSKKLRTKSLEGSSNPEENLKQLQVHKSNLFELSLPNRVTKIIEARPYTSIRDSIVPVLKKYHYSLDIMEVKLTNTLQPIDITAQAATLIGKHVSIVRSKHTVCVIFPDHSEVTLPAKDSCTVRQVFDKMMVEKGQVECYSVFLEGARAPIELSMSAGNLEGHKVTIQFNPPSTPSSNTASIPPKKSVFNLSSESGSSIGSSSSSGKLSDGVDELFSMIARLNSDTLLDQRTHEEPVRKLSPKEVRKNKKSSSSPRISPKFTRTKSGTAISEKLKVDRMRQAPPPPPRSLSPPAAASHSLPPQRYPPPPSSDPPHSYYHHQRYYDPYSSTDYYPRHHHQRSADAMSGVSMDSGSSVDSITHELAADRRIAARNHLREWVNNSSNGPQYFPTALGSQDTLERMGGASQSQLPIPPPRSRGSSLTRHQAAAYRPAHTPLDRMVSDSFLRQGGGGPPSVGMGGGYQWRRGSGNVGSDVQQFSDVESMASSGCHSNTSNRVPPLSPTTHVLVVEEQQQQQHSETFV